MPYFKILIASCFLTILFSINGYGQRQDAVWCFGDSIMMRFDSSITITKQSAVNSIECSASISNKQGNLLFYVGGYDQGSFSGKIWDSTNNIMQNGDSISLYASSTTGALIIPFPVDTNKYYVITHNWNNFPFSNFSLLYNVVDISQNNGLGRVTIKNQYLTSDSVTEKITIIRHGNGKDWWLIYHSLNGNTFFVSLVDSIGIHPPQTFNTGSNYIFHFAPSFIDVGLEGELTSSTEGDKLIAVGKGIIDLFDFDRCSGTIYNYQNLQAGFSFSLDSYYYGCSISYLENFLYVSNSDPGSLYTSKLLQFDLNSSNIASSQQIIFSLFNTNYSLGQHQIGPDNKIYVSRCFHSFPFNMNDSVNTYLSVINIPDSVGSFCKFELNSFYLNGNRSYSGLPNMPNYNLGRLIGSACDTITGIAETNNSDIDFKVFPNPSIGKFEITFSKNKFNNTSFVLNVFSIEGKLLKHQIENVLNAKAIIDLSAFSNGVYFLKIKSDDANFAFRKKLMIEK